jgi:hypothetical protein
MAVSRFPGTKINGINPPLTAVRTAYATEPFLPFLHPPIELRKTFPVRLRAG